MATKLNTQFSLNLGKLVAGATEAFVQTRKTIQAKQEADFQNAVLTNGMSLADQLAYRREQLDKATQDNLPDPDFISNLKSGISSLTKLVRFEKAQKDYFNAYNSFKNGKDNIDHVISILQEQLDGPLTPEEYSAINTQLNSAFTEKATIDNDILTNRVTLAKNDGTEKVLNEAIDQVKTRIAKAQAANNDADVSKWGLQLQSLQQTLNTNKTVMASHDLDLNIGRSAYTAKDKLKALNDQIAGSDGDSQIIVNGTKYNSAKEYWTMQRNDYLAGNGKGNFTDYFGEFQKEIKNRMDSVTQVSKFGNVPVSMIDDVRTQYQNLLNKDEMKPFAEQINREMNLAVGVLVNKTAQSIVNEAEAFGNFDQATQALTALQTKYGVDMASELADLANKKIAQAEKIKQVESAAEVMARQNGTTPQKEAEKITNTPGEPGVSKDVIGGTGYTKDAAGNVFDSTGKQVKYEELPKGTDGKPVMNLETLPLKPATPPAPSTTPAPTPQTTPTPNPTPTTTPPAPTPTPSPTSTQPSQPSTPPVASTPQVYTVKKGDNLSTIAKTLFGDANRFKEIADLNKITDPNKISVGQQIKLPTK